MSESSEIFSKKQLITIGVIFLVVVVVGLILIFVGYNDAFYSTSPTMRSIFKYITYLGEPIVFIVIVAIFFIAYDKKFAKNLALSLMFSTYVNEFVKNIFMDPRPATNIVDSTPVETSYGFPSNHTQSAVAFWGYFAYNFRKRLYIPIILGVVIFLVSISRLIVGVHDLQDVIGGFAIGVVVVMLFIYLEPHGTKLFNALKLPLKLVIVIVVSLALFLVGIFLFPTSGTDLALVRVAFSDAGGFAQVGGVLFGFGIAYVLEGEYVKYDPSKLDWKWRIINLVIGLVIVFVIYFGLEAIKGVFDSVFYRFARYAIIGFILGFILPLIFVKIHKV
ncbi:MAG: phosphatase PAP2 family protein [Candidatus Lokiarchaeota archaeon]|nr:phosphatase PAP2 family protein [Candidatus Lokiarchaeota archaeon]